MTAQVHDSVIYQEEWYALGAVAGKSLFEMGQLGLNPLWTSTACWAGYHVTYAIRNGHLVIDRISTEFGGDPPLIFGKAPHREENGWGICGDLTYADLNHVVNFTGKLLLVHDFIDEYYVHGGHQSSWKFKNVHEVTLNQGKILSIQDRSGFMAAVRRIILKTFDDRTLDKVEQALLNRYHRLNGSVYND